MISTINASTQIANEDVGVKKAQAAAAPQPVSASHIDVKEASRNGAAEIKAGNEAKNGAEEKKVDPKELKDFVGKANELVMIFDKSVKFVVDDKSGKKYIDIIDNNTNEVIKQIPPENIRKFIDAVSNMLGIIVDKKA